MYPRRRSSSAEYSPPNWGGACCLAPSTVRFVDSDRACTVVASWGALMCHAENAISAPTTMTGRQLALGVMTALFLISRFFDLLLHSHFRVYFVFERTPRTAMKRRYPSGSTHAWTSSVAARVRLPSISAMALGNLETALRSIATIAALVHPCSDDLGHEALHRQTDTFVFAGQGRERATGAADNDAAVALDARHRSQMLVHHLACVDDARPETPRYSFAPGQLPRELLAGPSQQRLSLMAG